LPGHTNISPPAFTLPAALLSQGFTLHVEREDDIPFLQALFNSTREEELAQAPWSPEQKSQFLLMQFNAQRTHYRTYMPEAHWLVIVHDGAPVGRIYIDWGPTTLNLVDIALIPPWRARGVGSQLMAQLIALADYEKKTIVLFVERFNPAMRLYRRLGFIDVRDTEIYLEMERPVGGG
jgi:ribosomal protein S18 acetylase RimI-like enzyme